MRLRGAARSLGLLGVMGMIVAMIAWSLFGGLGLLLAGVLLGAGIVSASLRAGAFPVRGAMPLPYRSAPTIHTEVLHLARRAGLPATPFLYLLPSDQPNAFTLGDARSSSVVVTSGLLRLLSPRELRGVLAHEIAHVRNGDLATMTVGTLLLEITRYLSMLGQLLLLLNLPLMLIGYQTVPWLLVLMLLVAPTLSGLLTLALSRGRELDADLEVVRLTGDPLGLARALQRLEMGLGPWLARLLLGRPLDLLRSHPSTRARVARLLELDSRDDPSHRASHVDPPVAWWGARRVA